MKGNLVRLSSGALLALAVGTLLGACEQIVYRDRPIFQEPTTAAAGFVGYSDAQQKLTVCGNCHTSVQRQWRETAHAGAWQRVLGLGGEAQTNFGQYHTTNQIGNVSTTPGGWTAVTADQRARYQDVQCESCHGPGLDHVRAPSRTNWPLASLAVGTAQPRGCGECHSTTLDPYHQEWARSAHALMPNTGSGTGSRAANPSCNGCHTGEDALVLWGVRAEFAEKSTHVFAADPQGQRNLAITCGVCHDPHRADIPGQLRHPIDVPSEEDNLCMKCHHKRGTPDLTTFRGPHSPEGPTLLGFAGAWLPGMVFPGGISATHGSERNPRLCAGCHVVPVQGQDPVTGQTVTSTGHTFEATPCIGTNGLPVAAPCPEEQKTYRTCTGAGCHANEQTARGLENLVASRFIDLTNELSGLLQRAHRQGGRTDNWWTCRGSGNCPGSPLHWATSQNQTWTVALSAAWNFELIRRNTGGGGALRMGQVTHNPILIETLLRASIREMRREYNLPAVTPVSLEQTIGLE